MERRSGHSTSIFLRGGWAKGRRAALASSPRFSCLQNQYSYPSGLWKTFSKKRGTGAESELGEDLEHVIGGDDPHHFFLAHDEDPVQLFLHHDPGNVRDFGVFAD